MDTIKIKPPKKISGAIVVPPDKSISHRAVMFGAIAEGATRIKNFLFAEDCVRTIDAFRQMGVKIDMVSRIYSGVNLGGHYVEVKGVGLHGLKKPAKPLYCGNSGTTMRLLSGILAGQGFESVLSGDESLSKRPMARITEPLRKMGAEIKSKVKGERLKANEIYPPLIIEGARLKAVDYTMPVASAQVKSCILLAGLYADGVTCVTEPIRSRDHTERMLGLFGAEVKSKGLRIFIKGGQKLKAQDIEVPADISSAAFFIVAASIVKGSKLIIKNVGINPTRTGVLDVMKEMGANIKVKGKRLKAKGQAAGEPRGDLVVEYAGLKAVTIKGDIIPRLIDELPVIMVAATQAKGTTRILNAKELRVKETDRIKSIVWGLEKMGADITVKGDDVYIKGPVRLKAARLKSFGDHRTAMSFAIAGLVAQGETVVEDTNCILTSFPNFRDILSNISQ
jgi:3-phosphoshikimate 1-carboxyvinyltransferase